MTMPTPPTRDQARSARKRLVRAASVDAKQLAREHRHLRLVEPGEAVRQLPATRGDCERGPRPCPYVSCTHHLWLDVSPRTGSIRFNFPDLEPHELRVSCALDVADEGPMKLETVGEFLNVTRERARQIERAAVEKLARTAVRA